MTYETPEDSVPETGPTVTVSSGFPAGRVVYSGPNEFWPMNTEWPSSSSVSAFCSLDTHIWLGPTSPGDVCACGARFWRPSPPLRRGTPHTCPVCGGRGRVPASFYGEAAYTYNPNLSPNSEGPTFVPQSSTTAPSLSPLTIDCRSCEAGVVWGEDA